MALPGNRSFLGCFSCTIACETCSTWAKSRERILRTRCLPIKMMGRILDPGSSQEELYVVDLATWPFFCLKLELWIRRPSMTKHQTSILQVCLNSPRPWTLSPTCFPNRSATSPNARNLNPQVFTPKILVELAQMLLGDAWREEDKRVGPGSWALEGRCFSAKLVMRGIGDGSPIKVFGFCRCLGPACNKCIAWRWCSWT